jgi:hypothetical protein
MFLTHPYRRNIYQQLKFSRISQAVNPIGTIPSPLHQFHKPDRHQTGTAVFCWQVAGRAYSFQ